MIKPILKFITGMFHSKKNLKARTKNNEKQKQFERALTKNPYLQSKALWDDMYGSLQLKLENSYRLIFILSLVIAVAMVGFIVVAGETKVKPMPFILHGNAIVTLADTKSESFAHVEPKLSLYFAKKFIRDARTVSTDGDVNAAHKIRAYSMVGGAATQVLKDFYAKENPDTVAQTKVKTLAITSILRDSPHTLDIRWREECRSSTTGELMHSKNYIAELTYRFVTPSQNETILANNPLGFEITYLSWSEDNNNPKGVK